MTQGELSKSDGDLPPGLLEEGGGPKLHLGGTQRKEGWQLMNALPGDHVDHLGDIRDLSRFADERFDVVYASHVLEHLGYQRDLPKVLAGIARVLRPGGRFFVSVPDLGVLTRIFAARNATPQIRFDVMRMMFGGQLDEFDFHFVGFWDDYLASLLFEHGFTGVYRVPTFGLFEDTSNMAFGGHLISLNMVAVKGG